MILLNNYENTAARPGNPFAKVTWIRLSGVTAAELAALFATASSRGGREEEQASHNTFFAVDRYLKSFCYNASGIAENVAFNC